jgi:hypothetical protein
MELREILQEPRVLNLKHQRNANTQQNVIPNKQQIYVILSINFQFLKSFLVQRLYFNLSGEKYIMCRIIILNLKKYIF